MFVLPFRELNLIRDDLYSLHKLLLDFHPELQDLDSQIYEKCKVVLIFDGLDESRMTLMFTDTEKVSDVTETSSLSVLMSNLIKGDLLPSALIWITSRPAAANQIPSEYITRVTEIQGFNDPQKEEYFRKRISDEHQANRIISHIRRARSLHIMCHIPVFCWISSTVLQKILTQHHREEIPKTLSEMYIHFLLIQMKMKNEKYEEKDPEKFNRDVIVKLSEVAFKQLMKGNVMFYEEDLRECGIDVTDASVYSGICTEIFKEESVFHQRKIYSFIHLSFQEFLAALFVFHSYLEKNMESLESFPKVLENTLPALLKSVIDESLESKTGHLDLFLRFLLGISLESNQRLLQDLLTHTQNTSDTIKRTTEYVKEQIKDAHLSAERSINLFLCLLEVNDQTLFREIQEFVKSKNHSQNLLSLAHCSAIAYMIVMSEEVLDEFDLRKFSTTHEARLRLIPAVMNCTRALLMDCFLVKQCCESLASALQSSTSLRELDLSNNDLQDSGVKLICDALKNSHCQLEKLRLAGCYLTDECCESLASVLQSSKSLRELDLSENNLQDSGVKLISDALKSLNCQLEKLRLAGCNLTDECCESLASVLQSSNSLRELDLSENNLQDSGVKLISDALKNSHCQLEILRLSGCMVTCEGCHFLASALRSNHSHLIELDLSYNDPGSSGVQILSGRLNDPNCTLNKLNVDHEGEFRITAGLQKYACDFTLDRSTETTYVYDVKFNPIFRQEVFPNQFEERFQVLCRESLTGRCYWEVVFRTKATVLLTYKRFGRMRHGEFGFNEKTWRLTFLNFKFIARHNNIGTFIPVHSPHTRVGVHLDWSAGVLSFYSVSDTHTLTHIHTFNTTFTEPLYAGFEVPCRTGRYEIERLLRDK